jgi:DNA-binding MarR family transcriptional regulator
MKLFAGLRKIRTFEKLQLPFLKSVFDFDIVIEIGYAEEQNQPLTVKQFFLLNICSPSTVRRKLAALVDQGIVVRRKHARDNRTSVLLISSSTIKQLHRYGAILISISAAHFRSGAKKAARRRGSIKNLKNLVQD